MANYFNVKDFDSVQLKARTTHAMDSGRVFNARLNDDASGKQVEYDVFISHSSENKDLIRKLRQVLEDDYNLSAYIDWDEDAGMSRDEVADKVKDAMDRSNSLIYVKTSKSDNSQWVAWEVGRYDANKSDRIGVLLIEDEKITADTWEHREFLKDYQILEKEDIKAFVQDGVKKLRENKRRALASSLGAKTLGVAAGAGTIVKVSPAIGQATKFFGTKQ